jgi:hypothetical protein
LVVVVGTTAGLCLRLAEHCACEECAAGTEALNKNSKVILSVGNGIKRCR